MATIEQVRAIFPVDMFPEITLRSDFFIVKHRENALLVRQSDIDAYLALDLASPTETSVFAPGYYEHALQRLSIFRPLFRPEERRVSLKSADESLEAIISHATTAFILRILQRPDLPRAFYRLNTSMFRIRTDEVELHDAFRILTIKISASQQVEHRTRPGRMRAIAEACLFNLAYGSGTPLNLSRSWERDANRLRRGRISDIQFPRRSYNSDLVSYYQLAVASDSLILAYLALYKIIEYFFSAIAEEGLHERIVRKIVAPEFSHAKPTQLRQLVSVIRKYDQRMDEEKTLAAVIEYYFRPDEIATWVRSHEDENGTYFTTPQTVLGQTLTLDLNAEQIASSLAKRIYHLRNALVHNKEGDLPRFIPFSGQEAVLSSEIPILQFLSEQLILRTGTDL
jgi:hypothetical protein